MINKNITHRRNLEYETKDTKFILYGKGIGIIQKRTEKNIG